MGFWDHFKPRKRSQRDKREIEIRVKLSRRNRWRWSAYQDGRCVAVCGIRFGFDSEDEAEDHARAVMSCRVSRVFKV